MALGTKLITAFLACGLIPLGIVAFMSYTTADRGMDDLSTCGEESLTQAAFNQLTALRDVKKAQIEKYFAEREGDMGVLVETVKTLRAEAFDKLSAVREVKRSAIERYFNTIRDQVITFSENGMVVDAMRELPTAFSQYCQDRQVSDGDLAEMRAAVKSYYTNDFAGQYRQQNQGQEPPVSEYYGTLDPESIALQYAYIKDNPNPLGSKHLLDAAADDTRYSKLHARIHPVIRDYLEKFGYYDIFLVDCETGEIVYSVFKELDYSTSLIDGPYADTNFGEAFRKANAATRPDEIFLVDYKCYPPSYEAPASFIASPIFDGDKKIGVALFQMPLDRINVVMSERAGLGETGETYLVGPDYLMRSDSFLDPENHSVIASFRNPEDGAVRTKAAEAALRGERGAQVVQDYNGNPVLSAYCPVELCGIRWALLAEIDVAEAFCPHIKGQDKDYFARYTEQYGYYDLFLLNPDGYCFYTVAKEADYQTNFVDGQYRDSGLGELTRQVLNTGKFGFADFSPYAPSNGDQAAFIAQPIKHGNDIEAVVALQLSPDDINAMMNLRTGMGETGCTYLVARDKEGDAAFRSDLTYMDDRYVIGYKVSTDYINEALTSGETNHDTWKDTHGNGVIVAYTDINVYGKHWSLISKINEEEALAAVAKMNDTAGTASAMLVTWVGSIGGVAAVLVAIVSVLIARSISKPINRVIVGLTEGADQVNDAAGQVSGASQQLAEGASEQASSLEETSSALEQMAAMTRNNADNSKKANALARTAQTNADQGGQTMEQLNQAMEAINQSAGEIGRVIKVIEEIAFQTNLLALNAAVEAARAGEHGKGFAVVAEEVRNLAMRAGEAARETTGLIEGSVERAKEGTNVAHGAADVLKEIVSGVRQVAGLLDGISQASQEQAQGVEQVNMAVSQMDKVTQQNAAGAEESASAAEELSAQAQTVKSIVLDLSALVSGTRNETDAPVQPQPRPQARRQRPAPAQPQPKQHAVPTWSQPQEPQPAGHGQDDGDTSEF